MADQIKNDNTVTRQQLDQYRLLDYANQHRINGYFNDVTVGVGSHSISANRMVLSCYSNYFQTMFKTKTDYHNSVRIDDVHDESVISIIEYIYTRSININKQNVINLLSAAHLLQMNDVKQFCFEYLESNINSDNCISVIKLAQQYNNKSLLTKHFQYLSQHFTEISNQDEFKNLTADDLVSCVTELNNNEVDQMMLFEAIVTWTKHDQQNRMVKFPMLFQTLKLEQLSSEYIIDVVSKHEFVQSGSGCSSLVLNVLPKVLKREQLKETGSTILSLGGVKTPSKVTRVFSLLDEQTKQYPELPIRLRDHCSFKLDDFVYCIGGKTVDGDANVCDKVWQMTLKQENLAWNEAIAMNEKRWQLGATIYFDNLVVTGGGNGKTINESNEMFVKSTKQWKTIPPLQQIRMSHAMAAFEGSLLVIGGWCKQSLSSAEQLTDLTSTWKYVESLQTPRMRLAAVNCRGCVYAIGGQSSDDDSTRLKSIEKYDADLNKWIYVSEMKNRRSLHAACVLQDKIYVVGGGNSEGQTVKEIECYDPSTDEWSVVGKTEDELYSHSLVVV